MKVHVTKIYYKNTNRKREPICFTAKQPRGIGTDIHAEIKLDPILKKHKDLRKAMLKHEVYEITDWGNGCNSAHKHAKHKEPKLTREIGGAKGFWKEIKRREK
jgi:hypothetical protein